MISIPPESVRRDLVPQSDTHAGVDALSTSISRRAFVGGVGATLLLSGSTVVRAASPASIALNAWLRISQDDQVTVTLSQSEMGQGISTTLPAVLVDELGADWTRVKFEWADFDPAYRHPQYQWMFTGNSESISTFFPMMRTMGAAAREMLAQAAAARWGVSAGNVRVAAGQIHHDASRRVLKFGDIAADAAKLPVPASPVLRNAKQLTMLGKPLPRVDIPAKVDGSAIFGIDVKVPNMVVAAIRRATSPGAKLTRYDEAAIRSQPGVLGVVEIPSGLAVVAEDFWTAKRALDSAELVFAPGPLQAYSTEAQRSAHREALNSASFDAKVKIGDATGVLSSSAKLLEGEFEIPVQAHATMEPMNCTAAVTAERCELWAPTQGVEITHAAAKQLTGLSDDQIIIHRTLLGGGFGRRLLADFTQIAIIVAKAMQRPVKVIWTREEDMRYDAYRPPMTHKVRATLGPNGLPSAMHHRVVSPSHMLYIFPRGVIKAEGDWTRPIMPPAAYDPMAVEGVMQPPYAIPNYLVEQYRIETPLSVSVWRTTGHGPNNFVLESFIDELAHAAGQDPLAYRLKLAAADPRAVTVLNAVSKLSKWQNKPAPGRSRGIALAKAFGGYIAQVAEISVRGKDVKVQRVWSAVDIGQVIDPGISASNIEGGVVWGLSGLRTEVVFKNGEAEQTNFDTFEPIHLWETPGIETTFVNSSAKPTGVGEIGPVPTHAAICNAVFAATGERIRALPISRSGYRLV